jgi:hypothetical protein
MDAVIMRTSFHFGLIVLLGAALHAQDSARVVVLSPRVGETIDRNLRDRFLLFRNLPEYRSGSIFLLGDGRYVAHVQLGSGDASRDTVVEYREPYLRMLAEQINHFEELQLERYRMGSDPARLLLGRAVPLTETGAHIDTTRAMTGVLPQPTTHGIPMPADGTPWRLRPRPPRLGALTRPDSGLEPVERYADAMARRSRLNSSDDLAKPIDSIVLIDPMRLQRGIAIMVAGEVGVLAYTTFQSARWSAGWQLHNENSGAVGEWYGLDLAGSLPLLAFNEKGAGLLLRPHIGYAWPATHGGVDVLLLANNANVYLLAGCNVQKMRPNLGAVAWDSHMVLDQTKLRDMLYLVLGIGLFRHKNFYEFQWRGTLGTPLYSIPVQQLGDAWVDAPPSNYRGFGMVLFRIGWAL